MSEEDVGRDLHQNITDEENCNRCGVLGRGQVERLGHTGDLRGRDIILLSSSTKCQFTVCATTLAVAFNSQIRRIVHGELTRSK